MKIKNKKIEGKHVVGIFIDRGEDSFEMKAQAVSNMDEFEKICPEPKPPVKNLSNGLTEEFTEHPDYKKALEAHNEKRTAFLIIQSLRATDGLEWETVKEDESDTWPNYMDELKASDFTLGEINNIVTSVLRANSLDEDQLKSAYDDFLASNLQPEQST